LTLTNEEFERLKRHGALAAQLLADATFREIVKDIKNDAIRRWNDSLTVEKREDCWRDLHAIGRLENWLIAKKEETQHEMSRIETADARVKARQKYLESARG
jgi:hypothetical protein